MKAPYVAAAVLVALGLAGAAGSQTTPAVLFNITTTVTGGEQPGRLWIEQGPQQVELTRWVRFMWAPCRAVA